MKRLAAAAGLICLAGLVFALVPNTPPSNGQGVVETVKIAPVRPAKPAPVEVAVAPKHDPYTYGTREVCDGNRCYLEKVATHEDRTDGVYVKTVNGWEWEPGETYEIHDGVAYLPSLPGQPMRKAVRVSKRVGGAALKAGRFGLRVGTAPARFIFRRCRGGC